jgi:hypothetical protein
MMFGRGGFRRIEAGYLHMQARKLQIYNAMTLSKYFGNIQYFGCKTKVLIDNAENVTAWERS